MKKDELLLLYKRCMEADEDEFPSLYQELDLAIAEFCMDRVSAEGLTNCVKLTKAELINWWRRNNPDLDET